VKIINELRNYYKIKSKYNHEKKYLDSFTFSKLNVPCFGISGNFSCGYRLSKFSFKLLISGELCKSTNRCLKIADISVMSDGWDQYESCTAAKVIPYF